MEQKSLIQSVTFILSGALLQLFNGVHSGWASTLVSIFGFIIFFNGLSKLKNGLDETGKRGVSFLMIASLMGILAAIIDLIPLMGIFASIGFIGAFVVELAGFVVMRSSQSFSSNGKGGLSLLLAAMVLAVVQSFFGFLPFIGGMISAFFSLFAIVFVLFGWMKVQEDLIQQM